MFFVEAQVACIILLAVILYSLKTLYVAHDEPYHFISHLIVFSITRRPSFYAPQSRAYRKNFVHAVLTQDCSIGQSFCSRWALAGSPPLGTNPLKVQLRT